MERADRVDGTVATPGKQSSNNGKKRTALILYGSETGNAQDVAEEIARVAERLRFDTTVLDLDSIQLRDLLKPTVVMFAISTTGQGEMPQNARRFWKTLLSSALKPGSFRKLRFSSFGLGDSSYAKYNVAHRMVCGRLAQLGAQAFCDRGEGNEQHPEGHSAGLREFIVNVKQRLLEAFPLEDGVEPIAEDIFLEPKWKLVRKDDDATERTPATNGCANGERQALGNGARDVEVDDENLPSTEPLPVKDSQSAYIAANDRVTTPDHFQDVRLLDLCLQENISYTPGAVAVIYPKNFPEDVQSFIDLMNWQSVADLTLSPEPTATPTPGRPTSPSPLRHLDLTDTPLTLRYLLTNVLDIMSIPRRTFFATLSHFLSPSSPDAEYQRERLLELADPTLIDELWDYTTRPKRTILEAVSDFTALSIPYTHALTVLPIMKGRQFSIASGGALRQTPANSSGSGTRVQLLVAIANPPSPIIRYRRRYGVCTRYVATLTAGQTLNIGMQPGYLDVKPEELETPVVMIGPGTGVAPMRAMVHQRLLWAREGGHRKGGKGLEGDVLIFGCRSEKADMFFRNEWEQLAREENLTVLTAFSRDAEKPKRYVQDVIRAEKDLIGNALWEGGGRVYVCGSSGAMPRAVREALGEVIRDVAGLAEEQAVEYMERMEKEGRYKQETW